MRTSFGKYSSMGSSRSLQLGVFLLLAFATGCASTGRLATPSGKPEITIPRAYLKHATVAITSYNLSKGRELDVAKPDELVTYEAVRSADGNQQVTGKFVYTLIPKQDSIVITSKRIPTTDLDDDDASEDAAQASYDAQQQELLQIQKAVLELPLGDPENATTGRSQ